MSKGFVIFRDPIDGVKRGWKGSYHYYKPEDVINEFQFYIKPWDFTTPPQVLFVDEISEQETTWAQWLSEIELKSCGPYSDLGFEEFALHINFIKTGIMQEDFEKVVACRTSTIDRNETSLLGVFEKACVDYPNSFIYLAYHSGWGLWLGASPEMFATGRDNVAEISAVAGTILADDKNWTPKEELEQSVIQKYLNELLASRDIVPTQISEKTEIRQGNIKHLHSTLQFQIDSADFPSFLREMHPTPAVGGYPKREALLFIERFEDLERELFTGWVGWSTLELFRSWVNLRCCRIYKDKVRFFAGCGINAQSDPLKEWKETEAKLGIVKKYFV